MLTQENWPGLLSGLVISSGCATTATALPRDPVLQPLDNIELRDAILAYNEDGNPVPAKWPEAEFIVGNPPFLGTKLMREVARR